MQNRSLTSGGVLQKFGPLLAALADIMLSGRSRVARRQLDPNAELLQENLGDRAWRTEYAKDLRPNLAVIPKM